jgi:hypothetical protein
MLVIKKNTKPHQRLWGSGLMTFFPSCMQASRRVVLLLKWLWCFIAREEDLLMSVDHGLALLSFETPLPPRGFLLLRCGSFVWWEGGHSINTAFHDGSLNAHSLDVCFLFSFWCFGGWLVLSWVALGRLPILFMVWHWSVGV